MTKATWDYGETTQSTGRRPGEEPGPGTSPETLPKFLNILGFGLLILQVDKAIPAPLSSSLTLDRINKSMHVKAQVHGRGWGGE